MGWSKIGRVLVVVSYSVTGLVWLACIWWVSCWCHHNPNKGWFFALAWVPHIPGLYPVTPKSVPDTAPLGPDYISLKLNSDNLSLIEKRGRGGERERVKVNKKKFFELQIKVGRAEASICLLTSYIAWLWLGERKLIARELCKCTTYALVRNLHTFLNRVQRSVKAIKWGIVYPGRQAGRPGVGLVLVGKTKISWLPCRTRKKAKGHSHFI